MKNKAMLLIGVAALMGSLSSSVYSQSMASTTTIEKRFAEIQDATGEVTVKATSDDHWSMAVKGMKMNENGEIKTGKDSTAVILLDEKGATGKVDIKPNSWMRIAELGYDEKQGNKKTLLDLALWQVLVKAEKLKGESSFQVRTPTSTTSVRGTVFEVKVEEE